MEARRGGVACLSLDLVPGLVLILGPSRRDPQNEGGDGAGPRPGPNHAQTSRRRFSEEDKRRIVEEAARAALSVTTVARRYKISIGRRIPSRATVRAESPTLVKVRSGGGRSGLEWLGRQVR